MFVEKYKVTYVFFSVVNLRKNRFGKVFYSFHLSLRVNKVIVTTNYLKK